MNTNAEIDDFGFIQEIPKRKEQTIESKFEEISETYSLTEVDKLLLKPIKLYVTDAANVLLLCMDHETNTYRRVSGDSWCSNMMKAKSPDPKFKNMLAYAKHVFDTCLNDPSSVKGSPIGFTRNQHGTWSKYPSNLQSYYKDAIKKAGELSTYLLKHEPIIFSNDPSVINYGFFDLSKIKPGPHPHWDDVMTRMPSVAHAEAFQAFVYSLFVAENQSTQLAYFYDGGGQGKSHMMMAIQDALGSDMCAIGDGFDLLSTNQFAMESIHGKHLYVVDDNKNPSLIKSGRMHSMLAGANMVINRKGLAAFGAYVKVRAMVGSNETPSVDITKDNERRRLIYFPLKNYPDAILKKIYKTNNDGELVRDSEGNLEHLGCDGNERSFKQRLTDELLAFLYTCKPMYEKRCPTNGNIEQQGMFDEMYNDCTDPVTDLWSKVLDRYIITGAKSDSVQCLNIKAVLNSFLEKYDYPTTEREYRNFRDWLLKKSGISQSRRNGVMVYTGIKELCKGKITNTNNDDDVPHPDTFDKCEKVSKGVHTL